MRTRMTSCSRPITARLCVCVTLRLIVSFRLRDIWETAVLRGGGADGGPASALQRSAG